MRGFIQLFLQQKYRQTIITPALTRIKSSAVLNIYFFNLYTHTHTPPVLLFPKVLSLPEKDQFYHPPRKWDLDNSEQNLSTSSDVEMLVRIKGGVG